MCLFYRSIIERGIGVLKRRWGILHKALEFSINTQQLIIASCVLLHNFIRTHDQVTHDRDVQEEEVAYRHNMSRYVQSHSALLEAIDADPSDHECSDPDVFAAHQRRDRIAELMWNEYVEELAKRGRDISLPMERFEFISRFE